MADINLNIALSIQEATKSIQNFSATAEKSLDKVIKSSDKTSESLSGIEKSVSIIGQATSVAIGTLMVKAFDAAVGAATSLFNTFVTDGISAFRESEDAIVKLNSALAAQGDLTVKSQGALLAQASALQATTKFTDEAVIGVQSLLTNLTSLDVNGIQKATESTLGLATALGIDTETAATVVSKALEGNVGALKKYGIAVKEGANETETFNNVIGALNQRFGTASADAVQTFSGAITKLKNSVGDLQEETGSVIGLNPALISAFSVISDIIDNVKKSFIENKAAISEFITTLVQLGGATALTVADGLFQIYKAAVLVVQGFDTAGNAVDQLGSAFNRLIGLDNALTQAEIDNYTKRTDARLTNLAATEESYNKASQLGTQYLGKVIADSQKEVEIANTKFQTLDQQAEARKGLAAAQAEEEQIKTQEKLAAEINQLITHNENLKAIDANRYSEQIKATEAQIALKTSKLQQGSQKEIEIERKLTEMKRAELNARLNQSQTFFGNLATLTQTANKDLFAIGKVAALAQASIATAQAVLNALAVPPYPVGLALAISAGIAGAVQIAKISSTNLATGITEVPKGFPNDGFAANLSSGERVVSVNQNMDLKSFMEENQGSKSILLSIADKLDAALIRPIIVEIEGKAVFTAVNDQLQGGRAFAV